MLALFYRAWASCEQAVSFDREDEDLIGKIINSIAGNLDGVLPDSLPKHTAQYFSRFFACSVKNADGLEDILSSFFNIPVKIVQRVASSHKIPQKFRCVLGNNDTACLGRNAQIGSKYFSCSKKIIIEIGPASLDFCRTMLPGSRNFQCLTALVNLYLDKPLEYDVKFLLTKDSILQCSLNGSFALGRGIWLASNKCNNPELELNLGASRLNASHHKQLYNAG